MREGSDIYLLGIATFVTFLSAQLIKPILPTIADRLGAGDLDIAAISGIPFIILGLLQIFAGALADRYGRRRMIALGSLLAATSSILCVLAWSWKQLLILRGLGAAADAIVGPALLALVAEVGGREKGKAMGVFRSCQGWALVLGPMIGGALGSLSLYTPFYVDFGLTILGVSLFLFLVPEVRGRSGEEASSLLQSLKVLKQEPALVKAAFLGFTEVFAFAALFSLIPALAIDLGMSAMEIAALLTAETITFTITNAFVGALSDRVGRKPIAVMGLIYSSVNLAAFFLVEDFLQTLLLMALYGVGASSVYLMGSTMAADLLPEEGRATLFGAFDALMDLGLIVGPSTCFTFLATSGLPLRYSFPLMAVPSLIALPLILWMEETKT